MQQLTTMREIHAVMEAYYICGKPTKGLTHWVPKQVDGNTLDDGELVYGSCEEDLYYEIWETDQICNCCMPHYMLVW